MAKGYMEHQREDLIEALCEQLGEAMDRRAERLGIAITMQQDLLDLQRRTAEALERIATLLEERLR